MAGITLGELVAHLDIDDREWRQGMTRAQQDLKKIEAGIKSASAPVERFGNQLTTASRRVASGVAVMDTQAKSATISVNRLQSGLLVLASGATGANPAVARLATTISAFAIGGWVTVGVLAGLAAIGAAWSALTSETRKAREETEKLIDKMLEAARVRALGPTGEQDAVRAEAIRERDVLKARRLELTGGTNVLAGAEGFSGGAVAAEIQNIDKRLGELLITYMEASRQIDEVNAKTGEEAKKSALEIELFNIQLREMQFKASQAADGIRAMMIEAQIGLAARGLDMGPRDVSGQLPGAQVRTDPFSNRAVPIVGNMAGLPNAKLDLKPLVEIREAASTFDKAVGSFGNGVKEMVKATFSHEGLANIGANLASNAIGMVAGKLTSVVGDWLSGADELQAAINRNTRALQAGTEFLAARLAGSGMTDRAREIIDAIQDTINRVAVGEGAEGPLGIDNHPFFTFLEELRKRSLNIGQATELADFLGIDITQFSTETLQQFFDQLNNAVDGLDSLGEEARKTADAFKNIPEGFKIGARILEATGLAASAPTPGETTETGQRPLDRPEWWKAFFDGVDTGLDGLGTLGDEARLTADALASARFDFVALGRAFAMLGQTAGTAPGGDTTGQRPLDNGEYWSATPSASSATVNIQIDAKSMTPDEIFAAAERYADRAASRGRPVALPRGMTSR